MQFSREQTSCFLLFIQLLPSAYHSFSVFIETPALKSLSNVARNTRIVKECLGASVSHLSGCHLPLSSWPSHGNSSYLRSMFCSTARLTWPTMDRKRTSQLLQNIISITVAMIIGNCVMGRRENNAMAADPLGREDYYRLSLSMSKSCEVQK